MKDGEPPSGRTTSSSSSCRTTLNAARRSRCAPHGRAPQTPARLLAILGPGMITANAGNDAGGIATFASVGADFGYSLLWILIPITISLGIVQEMCARMGAVTGKGLADLIRERFGVRWTALIMLALLIANAGVTVSEFVGIAAATELFGVSRFISVPLAAISSGGWS
jgi:NRAMP (natural resistance-associated macrophage protein)-like metal ion transporter